MPITIFSLSIYCRMSKQSHTLGKTFGIAELSVDVNHLLAEDVYDHVNSPGISHLYFHSSSVMVNI